MDHSAAQASFVEITFGLNSLFAVYERFRNLLAIRFAEKIKECSARLKAIEPTGDSKRVGRAVIVVEGIANRHLAVQDKIADWMIPTSFLCAVLCVLILYFDLLDSVGHWSVVLILPLPAYTFFLAINYWLFHRAKEKKMANFAAFVTDFESGGEIQLPEIPQPPNSGTPPAAS